MVFFFFFNYDFPQRIFAETLVENKDDFLQTFSTEKDFTRYCIFEIFACLGPELSIRQFGVLVFLISKVEFFFSLLLPDLLYQVGRYCNTRFPMDTLLIVIII